MHSREDMTSGSSHTVFVCVCVRVHECVNLCTANDSFLASVFHPSACAEGAWKGK